MKLGREARKAQFGSVTGIIRWYQPLFIQMTLYVTNGNNWKASEKHEQFFSVYISSL